MKPKVFNKRLVLKKETIVVLSKTEISKAYGGAALPDPSNWWGLCFTPNGAVCYAWTEDPNFCVPNTI